MKKTTKLFSLLCATLMVCLSVSLAACNKGEGANVEEIDKNRTQLYVYNCNSGFGTEWIAGVKARYEELHKNDVYEEGKKGIQVYVTNRRDYMASFGDTLLNSREEVYFPDKTDYYIYYNKGVFADITEAVTTPIPGETKSIEDKMTEQQKAYFGIKEADGKVHYYAVPHTDGYSGLIYNVDVFDKWGYYFSSDIDTEDVSDWAIEDLFTKGKSRSKGPDGKANTSDDGLPATYEQFFILCDMISQDGNIPVTWTGENYKDYLNYLIQALATDYEGLEQSMLNYTLTGTAELVTGFEGNMPVTESKEITPENAWQLYAQAGKYYALDFVKKLVTTEKYHNELAFNSTLTQKGAQKEFLMAGYNTNSDAAMLCDGTWWEIESNQAFKDMKTAYGDKAAKENRNFAWMPLPKATQAEVDAAAQSEKPYTLYDEAYSIGFVRKNIDSWKMPIALDFIQFACNDESLLEYTQITSTNKALKFTMTEEQLAGLTSYARSLYDIKSRAEVVYPYSTTELYLSHQSEFVTYQVFRSTVKGADHRWAAEALKNGISTKDYFEGMSVYYNKLWTKTWGA